MAITKNQKSTILNQLTGEIGSQKAVVLITTRDTKTPLNANKTTEFRFAVRKAGIVVKVCKNTLIQKAFPDISENLVGQTFITFLENGSASDEVTVPKVITEAIKKEFSDNFNIIGSVINGEYCNAEKTQAIAKVPTHKDSMAMVASTLNQITAKIAIGIKEVSASVARGIKAAKAE